MKTTEPPNNYLAEKTKAQKDLAEWRAYLERQIKGTQPKRKRPYPTLWNLQRGRCWICGLPLDPKTVTRDHLHPKSKGGRGANNILLAHRKCNSARGSNGSYTREEALAILDARVKALKSDSSACNKESRDGGR